MENGNLKYVFEPGSGFDFQYGNGLEKAKDYINNKYGDKKNYIELSVFFTMTGNSAKQFTCEEIKNDSKYYEIAFQYNNAVQKIKDLGYTTKGYLLSHSPLNTKHPNASTHKIVYSFLKEACESTYRSAYKYWLSNRRIEKILSTGTYSNVTFVDAASNFVILIDEDARTFKWLNDFATTDGLHWDKPTTIKYMQLAFDKAGM